MQVLTTAIDTRSDTFRDNEAANLEAVSTLNAHLLRARAGGGERYTTRHVARGRLLPRDRVRLLLDRGSPFLELCPLAGLHESGVVPGGSLVGGIGWVHGTPCVILASDATVSGGAINAWGMQRTGRLQQIARENRLPEIHLVESAGADLPNQADIFVPGGAGFRNITQRSAAGLPTLALVFGPCTAGGAYVPGMADYVVMVKEQAMMYLAGPPLVKMATGEVVDDETLGGADVHSRISGVSDYLADDEHDALRLGRELIATWNLQASLSPSGAGEPPVRDANELLGIASADLKVPFDPREVLARVVDGSRFHEFKPLYGPTLICGFAEIGGYRVGVLANQGVLFTESAEKAAQFIQLCEQVDTPLLFVQNITGFMVGKDVEHRGIIKAGAKMLNAVSNAKVPAITLMIGGSYGAGNYAMAGRAFNPRFLFTWPNHKIAVMGGEQLAGVLDLVKREAAAKSGKPVDEPSLDMMKKMLKGKVDHESTCWSATGRLWDDGVIDPRQTRAVLSLALSAIHFGGFKGESAWGNFRH